MNRVLLKSSITVCGATAESIKVNFARPQKCLINSFSVHARNVIRRRPILFSPDDSRFLIAPTLRTDYASFSSGPHMHIPYIVSYIIIYVVVTRARKPRKTNVFVNPFSRDGTPLRRRLGNDRRRRAVYYSRTRKIRQTKNGINYHNFQREYNVQKKKK